MMFVLDTNVVSELRKVRFGSADLSVAAWAQSVDAADLFVSAITCPVLFVLGAQDQMTPPKAAQGLINIARSTGKTVRLATLPVGHNQMTEAPDPLLQALKDFFSE